MVPNGDRLLLLWTGFLFRLAACHPQSGLAYHGVDRLPPRDIGRFLDSANHATLNSHVLGEGTGSASPSYLQLHAYNPALDDGLEVPQRSLESALYQPTPIPVATTATDRRARRSLRRLAAGIPNEERQSRASSTFRALLSSSIIAELEFSLDILRVLVDSARGSPVVYDLERTLGTGTSSIVVQAVQSSFTPLPSHREMLPRFLSRLFSHRSTDTRSRVALRFPVVNLRKKQVEYPHLTEGELLDLLLRKQLERELHAVALVSAAARQVEGIDGKWGFVLPMRLGRVATQRTTLARDPDGNAMLNFASEMPTMLCDLLCIIYKRNRGPSLDAYVLKRVLQLAVNLETLSLVHLDITPQNVLIGQDGQLYLGDFQSVVRSDTTVPCRDIPMSAYTDPRLAYCAVVTPDDHVVVDKSHDAWMVGMLLLQWLCGDVFFDLRTTVGDPGQRMRVLAQMHQDFRETHTYAAPVTAFQDWERCRGRIKGAHKRLVQQLLDLNPFTRGTATLLFASYFAP
ncbi:conserved hypothetical protein [Neospora caninum Liverpool]|uniref:Rhoptry kinase family protein ROP11 (Incomplete catalytic triad) n=1 Tax=Neospora caninum (strain Liverpool) TaxID=572307 RepID=F0VLJ8_NEOCL|nr:conserved hypothetical protein [Neospora caninum Liverpool]CBZ54126.1 conserved hypothetical protein [Neospora caninum Liverpool]CEL68825.1 TPA: rhoptry kinase family protein ROP11 (incomplete catalytic triad) [Neospora caninum Liverpool]|eukprot:XP_003884157.1 conserved hypothetical protein [Neospora caninum Liverpool]